jgi:hypothetical protein
MWSSVGCFSCSSKNQQVFNGELALHYPGLEGLDKSIVWAFPEILICLDCGFAVFALGDDALKEARQLYVGEDVTETGLSQAA